MESSLVNKGEGAVPVSSAGLLRGLLPAVTEPAEPEPWSAGKQLGLVHLI